MLSIAEGRALIAAYGRALSPRAIEILRAMAETEDADPGDDDAEIAYERGVAYLATTRIAARTVNALLRACAISRVDTSGGDVEYYRINETGRALIGAKVLDANE